MSLRLCRKATRMLIVAAALLMTGRAWAVFHELGPSKDEWRLKYDVDVHAPVGDTVNIEFTLADEGRLKPIYSITVVAFSKQTDSQGGRSYDVKSPIELKAAKDGKRVGKVQIRKEFVDRAMIRILTLTVDGRTQAAGAAYYDIPIKKFLNKAQVTATRQTLPTGVSPSSVVPMPSKITK